MHAVDAPNLLVGVVTLVIVAVAFQWQWHDRRASREAEEQIDKIQANLQDRGPGGLFEAKSEDEAVGMLGVRNGLLSPTPVAGTKSIVRLRG